MMEGMFNGLFGRIDPRMCRLSINGDIAVKTSTGYKAYNMKKGTLVNCANFVFSIGEEFFFCIPTNKVEKGDIILVGGKPKCVIDSQKNKITAIDYESSEIKQIIPERHIFMGSTYFYGKIVSMFGNTNFIKGKKGINRMMQFMMMQEMMKGMNQNQAGSSALAKTDGNVSGGISSMLPFMMLGGMNFGDMFGGVFDFDSDDDDTEEHDTESESNDEDGIFDVETEDENRK